MLKFVDTEIKPAPSDTHWPPRRPIPHCTGLCDQGRKPCQAPQACNVDADEWMPSSPGQDAFFLSMVIAAFGVLGYVLWLLWATVVQS